MNEIQLQKSSYMATVILNRPGKLNALTKIMWRQLAETFTALAVDQSRRCIVIRGAGERAFSPGNDIREFETERCNSSKAREYGGVMRQALDAIAACPQPLVAVIKGICVGGGLEIAAQCDLRICAESSRFGVPVNRLGLVMSLPELHGLVRLVGRATALEILLEGRVFGAAEAKEKGLVTRVVPDVELEAAAAETVQRIVDGAPLVASWHKRFINRLNDPSPISEAEIDEGYECFDTEDFQEGYRAFLEKVQPRFKGK